MSQKQNKQKNFRIDTDTVKMLRDVHWYFEDQSFTIRTAIRLLYLYHRKRIDIDWKNEKPITWS
jgi:hypothetical protein